MKKNTDIEKLLKLLADMESFHPGDDYITQLIEDEKESELSLNSLDQVTAARGEKAPPVSAEDKNKH